MPVSKTWPWDALIVSWDREALQKREDSLGRGTHTFDPFLAKLCSKSL